MEFRNLPCATASQKQCRQSGVSLLLRRSGTRREICRVYEHVADRPSNRTHAQAATPGSEHLHAEPSSTWPNARQVLISVNPKAGASSSRGRVDRLTELLQAEGFEVTQSSDLAEVSEMANCVHSAGQLRVRLGAIGRRDGWCRPGLRFASPNGPLDPGPVVSGVRRAIPAGPQVAHRKRGRRWRQSGRAGRKRRG